MLTLILDSTDERLLDIISELPDCGDLSMDRAKDALQLITDSRKPDQSEVYTEMKEISRTLSLNDMSMKDGMYVLAVLMTLHGMLEKKTKNTGLLGSGYVSSRDLKKVVLKAGLVGEDGAAVTGSKPVLVGERLILKGIDLKMASLSNSREDEPFLAENKLYDLVPLLRHTNY